jgi:hypothetical protein
MSPRSDPPFQSKIGSILEVSCSFPVGLFKQDAPRCSTVELATLIAVAAFARRMEVNSVKNFVRYANMPWHGKLSVLRFLRAIAEIGNLPAHVQAAERQQLGQRFQQEESDEAEPEIVEHRGRRRASSRCSSSPSLRCCRAACRTPSRWASLLSSWPASRALARARACHLR